jgi:pyruvate formate lyase activating enzyme
LFHCLPGSNTLTVGMLGCDFHCRYCQNWLTSQALRDDAAGVLPTYITPDALVELARRRGGAMVASSYNEPLITAEWAVDVFKVARAQYIASASPEIPWHVKRIGTQGRCPGCSRLIPGVWC